MSALLFVVYNSVYVATAPYDRMNVLSFLKQYKTRNAWQNPAYSPFGTVVSPASE